MNKMFRDFEITTQKEYMTTAELWWCLHGDATTYKRFEFICSCLQSSRKELAEDIEELKKKVAGSE